MTTPDKDPRSISKYVQEIDRIDVIEVLRKDMDHLDRVFAREQQALGFLTFCAGTATSVVLTLTTADLTTVTAKVAHGVILAVSLLGTAWFSLTWWRESGTRQKVAEGIRAKKP